MKGICSNCREPCEAIIIDFGIGHYDYCGAKGYDTKLEAVSNCCETPVLIENLIAYITVSMLKECERS